MNDFSTRESIEQFIIDNANSDAYLPHIASKSDALFRHLLHVITDRFQMPFNSVFSQIAFVISQYKLDFQVGQALHFYRLYFLSDKKAADDAHSLRLRMGILSLMCDICYDEKTLVSGDIQQYALKNTRPERVHTERFNRMRFSIIENHLDQEFFIGISEIQPAHTVKVVLSEPSCDLLLKTLRKELVFFQMPVTVMLINVQVIKGDYYPESITLLPDFLMDVTSIAECYSYDGYNPNLHFLKKLMPKSHSDSLFIGLCANTFLDELVVNPDKEFKELTPLIFKISPLFLASKTDQEVMDLLQNARLHFVNIRDFVQKNMSDANQNLDSALIEPSYCSPAFGIQGRLDLYIDHDSERSIIELKSGKIYRPNSYQINQSHYIQTLLYDLLVRKNTKKSKDVKAFILYSKLDHDRLRYAPPVRSLQIEAMMVRNSLIAIEYRFTLIDANGNDPTDVFSLRNQLLDDGIVGFVARDLEKFNAALNSLSSMEYKYLKAFTGFVAREYFNAKSGSIRNQVSTGQASLWLSRVEDKLDNHSIMDRLLPEKVENTDKDTFITLRKSQMTDRLADFRVGDIIVLYASNEVGNFLWEGLQQFKGTLITNSEDEVTIKLRARQNRKDVFHRDKFWNIEKDIIDSNFGGQFKSMMSWAFADKRQRALLLGALPPDNPTQVVNLSDKEINSHHASLLVRALSAPDYFLLWGPPGTGKTSFMIKHLIRILIGMDNRPLLVIAYTNRAVDELCAAIESIGPDLKDMYLRVGSRFSTDTSYVANLLDEQMGEIHNRAQLLQLLHTRKIIVGTASSIIGKPELFDLLSFQRVLIDEASQILDPQIVEILSRVPRFIMIGDHKQMPAVVTQHGKWTEVSDSELNEVGVYDLSQSMFERLFLKAENEGWTWAYGILEEQGRMHQDIMDFPASNFYLGRLRTMLPGQEAEEYLAVPSDTGHSGFKREVAANRVLFLDIRSGDVNFTKMNDEEASCIHSLLLDLYDLYQSSGRRLEDVSIGVITPFRAQIVKIKSLIENLPFRINVTVDTVERFQGGSQDIVIISTVVSSHTLSSSIISTSWEGIDRKMNVALTRARERLIMVGNKSILQQLPYYKEFVERYGV